MLYRLRIDSPAFTNEWYFCIMIASDSNKFMFLLSQVTDLPEGSKGYQVVVKFIPTVPHCSLATLIGLSLRAKLQRDFSEKVKLQILIKEGTHSSAHESERTSDCH